MRPSPDDGGCDEDDPSTHAVLYSCFPWLKEEESNGPIESDAMRDNLPLLCSIRPKVAQFRRQQFVVFGIGVPFAEFKTASATVRDLNSTKP